MHEFDRSSPCLIRKSSPALPLMLVGAWLAAASSFPSRAEGDEKPHPGLAIYQRLCVSCHGPAGEGTPREYPHVLAGDKSVLELTKLIDKTMPKDSADECVGENAKLVAQYIYDAFYSPTAQVRNKPPRVELARLTVRQYQNSLADLLASFRGPAKWDGEPGLRGEYFKTRQMRRENRAIDRTDKRVQFDFKESSPDPGPIASPEFSMRWQGSVLAPETGVYEFVVRTENGARLWVNNLQQALVDAWVRSGSDTEFRQPIFLIGGRPYALRLEFFKFKEKTASIELRWRRPKQHVDELIDDRYLRTSSTSEMFIVNTPFPPDDRSVGYERGASVSKAWDQAITDAALETAAYVVARIDELAGAKRDAPDREAKLRAFCERFVQTALRRPLDDDLRRLYVERQFADAPDAEAAIKRVVLLTLKSPRFLYPEPPNAPVDQHATAARLALVLWDSLPDAPLREAAAKGQLATLDQVSKQAERMLADTRAKGKVAEFFRQWLRIDHVPDIAKDSTLYPDFNAEIAADLRASLELFIDQVIWSDGSDLRQLFTADWLPLNGRLARFYGADVAEDKGFERVALDGGQRAGVLSHPYLLAGFAYTATSSPIHRGVFVARSVLGRSLRQPPEAVAPLAPDLLPDLTTRQRVETQTKAESCQACHSLINSLGFPLESFDATGRWRKEEKGKPIDATGSYTTLTGEEVRFAGVRELAAYVAASAETRDAFVEQMYHYLVKQPFRAENAERREKLRQSFVDQGWSVRKLLVAIAAEHALPQKPSESLSSDAKPSSTESTP